MRPNTRPVRLLVPAVVSALVLIAVFLPAISRAAGQILVGLSVSPAAPAIAVGQTQAFTATGTYDDGSSRVLSGGTWSAAPPMITARYYHTATLLQDGSVLVAGGFNNVVSFATAERYLPWSNTWVPAGSMTVPRVAHTATLLPNGKVLVTGGIQFNANILTSTTDLYDPATNTWSPGPAMLNGVRAFHSAVRLNTGKVLITAGVPAWPSCAYHASSELYDSVSNTWSATGSLTLARSNATTTLMANGKVLLAGGPQNGCPNPNNGLNEAEVYDPATGVWTVTGNLSIPRFENFIAALPDGRILLAGGRSVGGNTPSADVFNPVTGTFSLTNPMSTARATSGGTGDNGRTVVLADGRVLVAGGQNVFSASVFSSSELFDPLTSTWTPTGSLLSARTHNTMTTLDNGQVLVTGGNVAGNALASSELYQPPIVWTSSNPSVATIDKNGVATAVAVGTTMITANSGSIAGGTLLTVAADTVAPATSASYAAPNANGWHKANVTVNLDATDSGGPVPASGVQSISYFLNGAQNGFGTINGNSTSLQIFNEGTTNISYFATDNNGNAEPSTSITIRIDKTAPQLFYPNQLQATATSNAGATVTFSVSANDFVSGVADPAVASPLQSGATFPIGTTTETVTATDFAGNTASASFDVVVSPGDTTPPTTTATYPPPNANGWHRFNVFINLGAFDSSNDGPPSGVEHVEYTLTGAQTGGAAFASSFGSLNIINEGVTTVTYHAADNRGNVEADRSFIIKLDRTPPTAANLSNIQVNATSASGAIVHFNLAPADALSGVDTVVMTQGLPSGSVFPHGTTNQSITITDKAGNTTFRTFSVTVNRALLSIAVTPSSATIDAGDNQPFQAIGHFTNGPDQMLPNAGSGGGTTPTLSGGHWHMQMPLSDALNASACGAGVGPYTSQPFSATNGTGGPTMFGPVNTTWGNPAAVQVTGSVNAQEVHLTLTCVPNNGAAGAIDATWTGTRFQGTWSFSGASGNVSILGWSSKAPLPAPRFSLGAAAVNGIVYAIGGNNPSQPSPVEAYTPATNSWATVSQLPVSVEGAAVAALNGIVYVAGGHVAGGNASSLLQAYDPAQNIWLPNRASMPTARAHHALVAAGGRLYAIGGETGAAGGPPTAVVEQYDPDANTWSPRAPLATPRSFLVAGALNGDSVIAAAGGNGGNGSTELYNVAGNSWSPGPAMVNSGGSPAAAVVNNAMFVFGINGNAVHMFRPASGNVNQPSGWAGMAPMPTSRGQLAVAAVGDVVYAIGGQQSGGLSTAVVEAFSAPLPSNFSVTSGGGSGGGSSLPAVMWSSSDSSIAQVNGSGVATGNAAGQATIIATAGSISCAASTGCATLTVNQPTHITFTLAPGSVPFGSVTVTLVDRTSGTPLATFAVPIGQPQEVSVEEADQIRLVFSAPPGYAVSPSEVEPDLYNGDLLIPLFFSVLDTTPPVLNLPPSVTVDATSPLGATVTFAASAMDAISGSAAVTCVPPSGSTFAIGATTVACEATDAAGNTATGSFTVLVQAAAAQVNQLIVTVQGFNLQQGISNSLDAKLANVLTALTGATTGNTTTVCNQLGAFINETTAQSGKKLTVAQAEQLIATAQQIRAVIGCQ